MRRPVDSRPCIVEDTAMVSPADSGIQRALALAARGDVPAAIDALRPALDDGASRPLALGHRAWLFRSLGRYEEALRDYDAIFAEDPANIAVAVAAAETRLLAGKIEPALAAAI